MEHRGFHRGYHPTRATHPPSSFRGTGRNLAAPTRSQPRRLTARPEYPAPESGPRFDLVRGRQRRGRKAYQASVLGDDGMTVLRQPGPPVVPGPRRPRGPWARTDAFASLASSPVVDVSSENRYACSDSTHWRRRCARPGIQPDAAGRRTRDQAGPGIDPRPHCQPRVPASIARRPSLAGAGALRPQVWGVLVTSGARHVGHHAGARRSQNSPARGPPAPAPRQEAGAGHQSTRLLPRSQLLIEEADAEEWDRGAQEYAAGQRGRGFRALGGLVCGRFRRNSLIVRFGW